jgi:solute:Na+ symporter, SSS family
MQPLDYAAIVAYLAITMLIVYRASRKQEDTEDFFLGNRSMPWFAVGLSIMATLLSTNTYLGAPGEMIKYGPAWVLGFAAYPLILLVVLYVWIPFFMRLRLTSAYDYLAERYDYRARLLGGLLFLGLRLGWMSMVVYTASKAMVAMVGDALAPLSQWLGAAQPIYPVIAVVGAAATIYACIGGMRAVIWTDVLQAFMLFGGVLVIILYVMGSERTGVGTWWQTVVSRSAAPPQVKWFSWDIAERTTILATAFNLFAWNVCTHCSDQVALQRYFTTSSIRAARSSFVVNIVSAASIGLLLSIAGLALRYFYLEHAGLLAGVHRPGGGAHDLITPESGADDLMPYFFMYQLPAGFGGLILVSFLCDAMQTVVSGVNSIAAIITQVLRERVVRHSDQLEMRLARGVTLGVGILTTLLALWAAMFALRSGHTIFDMLPRMFNMFLGPLAAMFILGMFCPRVTAAVVLPVTLVTQFFSSVFSWWAEVPHLCRLVGLHRLAEFWPTILGVYKDGDVIKLHTPSVMLAVGVPCLFGIGLGWAVSLVAGRREHPGTAFTWRAVLSRPPQDADG